MPVTASVTVASVAATRTGTKRTASNNTRTALTLLVFIQTPPAQIIPRGIAAGAPSQPLMLSPPRLRLNNIHSQNRELFTDMRAKGCVAKFPLSAVR